MAPNVSLNLFPTKQLRSAVKATNSVAERSGFPPKPTNSVTKASNSVTGRLVSSPLNLIKQLVFTEFGLSPVITMPSPELSPLPAEPYTPPNLPPVKPESPRSHPQAKIKTNNGCRCKQSRCLKLYCECFAAGAYCDGCNCSGCRNNVDYEALRQVAVKSILERNPFAFSPKIASPCIAQNSGDDMKNVPVVGKHNRGCGCKKTECLKKYCECYHAKVFCSENCKCVDCKNFEGCVERKALSKRDYNDTEICNNFAGCEEKMVFSHNNDKNINKKLEGSEESGAVTDRNHRNADICKTFQGCKEKMTFPGRENNKRKICIQQANAAISTAIGSTGNSFLQASGKRKFHGFLDSNAKDPRDQRLINDQKEAYPSRVCGALSASSIDLVDPVDPVDHVVSSTLGSSKFRCRSLLADKIHSREVEQLCSFLVLVSEGAKVLTDTQGMGENETANILGVQDMENCQEVPDVQKEVPDDHLSGNHADAVNTNNLIPGGIDIKEGRPSYVGKLALSDKKDRSDRGAKRLDQILKNRYHADVYIKQEKLVLASFRNCLRKIITLGNMKELMVGQCQHVDNPLQKTDLQHE